MHADLVRMGTLLIVHSGSQFKEQFSEHSTEAAQDLPGVRAALGQRRFDAVFVDASGRENGLGEMLACVRAADPCLTVVIGGIGWSPELRKAAESCEVLLQPSAVDVVQFAIRRGMRQTFLARENRELKADQPDGAGNGLAAGGAGERAGTAPWLDARWIEALPPRLDLREFLGGVEKAVIQKTLEATQGAQAEAARRLGLSRSDLSYKLSKYELRKPRLEKVQLG